MKGAMCSFNQCLHEASRSPAITAQSKCVSSSAAFYRELRVAHTRTWGGAVRGTDPFVYLGRSRLEKSAKSQVQSCVQHTLTTLLALLIISGFLKAGRGQQLFWSHVKKVDDVRKRMEKLLKCCSKSLCRRRCDPLPQSNGRCNFRRGGNW